MIIPVSLALAAGLLLCCVAPRVASAQGALRPVITFGENKLEEENVEGPDVARTYFMVGANRVIFGVPKDCRLVTNGDGFILNPTEVGLAGSVRVTRSPFTPEFDLAENVLKYRDAAADKIPGGAIGIEAQQPVMNPFPYNGWKSLGFTWKYSFYGRSLQRTVSYINLDVGVQVMVTTQSPQKDAEKMGKLAQRFMGSWWVKTSGTKKPDDSAAR